MTSRGYGEGEIPIKLLIANNPKVGYCATKRNLL